MYLKIADVFLKYVFNISKLSNYKIYKEKKIKNFDKIIVSWCYEKDFNQDGSYSDRYFRTNSKDNIVPSLLDFIRSRTLLIESEYLSICPTESCKLFSFAV